ncbi:lipoprotein lipase-like [Chironomus tepperi]|uniref:lipoprotein lipase-like n=1 Tax=Chironomus tepperi TaxID=113505 RepID=UPI00391F1EE1
MSEIVHNPEFDRKRPTVVYIHGFLGDGEFDYSVMAVRSAYRRENNQNFIAIDWSAYSRFVFGVPYFDNVKNLQKICEGIAEQLEQIRTGGCSCYKNFYLVGHSLGGQCAGLIGRHLKRLSNGNFVIPKIYALDPAGPDFEYVKFQSEFGCISKDDATYVQVIHTNGNKYGVKGPIGHADFYPNGGMSQPGCNRNSCSHQFAWIFYQQSVREEASFLARKCDSYDNFQNGNCENNEISYMGYSSNGTFPMGTYFLRTHPSKFGTALREDGLKNTLSYVILEDGTKTVNSGKFGFMAPTYKQVDPDQELFDKDDLSSDDNNQTQMLKDKHLKTYFSILFDLKPPKN